MNILIIDDEKALLKSTEMYLKTKGYRNIKTIEDSRLVNDYLKTAQPDMVLLDLNMPYVSGQDLLKEFSEQSLEMTIIIISATDDPKTIKKCMDLGVKDFLIKPLDNHGLIKCIEKFKSEEDGYGSA